MKPFFTECPQTAMRETRNVQIIEDRDGLRAGHYVFHEFYCDDLTCDCRRVIIRVHRSNDIDMRKPLATISYGWESPEFYKKWSNYATDEDARDMADITIDPWSSPPGREAAALRDLFEWCVNSDPELKARFPRHYREFRSAIRLKKRRGSGKRSSKRRRPD